jgi:hypothetical protein
MKTNHKVIREERLTVDLVLRFPNPHKNKSYIDNRRHYTVKLDGNEPLKIEGEEDVNLSVKLRTLVVVKKMFGKKIDSSLTYRVGENFAMLRINNTILKIAYSFREENVLEVLDNSSHVYQSRILEKITINEDE